MNLTRCALLVGTLVLVSHDAAMAAPRRSPDESAIMACHQTILDAARTLTSDIEGHLGRCVSHGVDCLTSSRDPVACCARIAANCDDDRSRIQSSVQEFETLIAI